MPEKTYLAALDIGTTTVRCFILNEDCKIQGTAKELVELVNPKPGYYEIEPDVLWTKIKMVITKSIKASNLMPGDISGLGISTQRGTFVTWNPETQEYYHNFITWKDLRANDLVDRWNNGVTMKAFHIIAYILYLITQRNRYLVASYMKLMNVQMISRLIYETQNNPRLKKAFKEKRARIDLLDSWILYKLRCGNGALKDIEHISDVTSCTATGLYDPFSMNWSFILRYLFQIETEFLPKVVPNSYENFGYIHPDTFNNMDFNTDPEEDYNVWSWKDTKIPIIISMSDQSASIFGSQCFQLNSAKITLGTGGFLNVNTGKSCLSSRKGLYPLIGWQFNDDTIYCLEGSANDMASILNWGQQCGFYNQPQDSNAIASSVLDTDGVYFISAFSGLGAPINDCRAATGFIGIKSSTKRAHLVRAILESLVFRLVLLIDAVEQDNQIQLDTIRIDGGVSRNNFVCQFLADVSGKHIERAQYTESSVMGITYAAGLKCGLWKDFTYIEKFRNIDLTFKPNKNIYDEARNRLHKWQLAVKRFGLWY